MTQHSLRLCYYLNPDTCQEYTIQTIYLFQQSSRKKFVDDWIENHVLPILVNGVFVTGFSSLETAQCRGKRGGKEGFLRPYDLKLHKRKRGDERKGGDLWISLWSCIQNRGCTSTTWRGGPKKKRKRRDMRRPAKYIDIRVLWTKYWESGCNDSSTTTLI